MNERIHIWKDIQGDLSESLRQGPALDTYLHSDTRIRPAVLICPGGGYTFVSEREGEPIALKFHAAGFQVFVLWYSIAPYQHPQPLLDASRAMCLIRQNAEKWKLDPERIAVCGFSAGGHLAASLSVHWNKPFLKGQIGLQEGQNKPNASILCYPVITSGEYAHRGSFDNLLGENATEEALDLMSLEKQVGDQTPPTFLWHTVADGAVPVENSMMYASSLRKAAVPFEMHLYPDGPHGLALSSAETGWPGLPNDAHVATWMSLCLTWLTRLFGYEV